jgi:DNA-binding NarL/FixJ family response regulator
MTPPLRLLLGDDHPLILNGIRTLLSVRYEIVGTAQDGRAIVEAAERLRPDIVVLDVSMPILNGIDAARQIRQAQPNVIVVFLTMHASPMYLRRALDTGALGYVLKTGAAEELLAALDHARRGRVYISPEFGADVIESVRATAGRPARSAAALTDRQRQILQLVAEGRQNKEMAEVLGVSVKTVEFHRGRLMAKLNARSVAELTRYAVQEGLIDPSAT